MRCGLVDPVLVRFGEDLAVVGKYEGLLIVQILDFKKQSEMPV